MAARERPHTYGRHSDSDNSGEICPARLQCTWVDAIPCVVSLCNLRLPGFSHYKYLGFIPKIWVWVLYPDTISEYYIWVCGSFICVIHLGTISGYGCLAYGHYLWHGSRRCEVSRLCKRHRSVWIYGINANDLLAGGNEFWIDRKKLELLAPASGRNRN